MKYKGYLISQYGAYHFEFAHEEYDGAPESYFSDSEQTPSQDIRAGMAQTLCDAKAQIDELIKGESE